MGTISSHFMVITADQTRVGHLPFHNSTMVSSAHELPILKALNI